MLRAYNEITYVTHYYFGVKARGAYENGKVQCKNGLKLFSRGLISTPDLLYYNDYFQFSNIR